MRYPAQYFSPCEKNILILSVRKYLSESYTDLLYEKNISAISPICFVSAPAGYAGSKR
jgi:hypothetical protein